VFERFTDRARAVLTAAQAEARELNHDFIGTEHMLLGVLQEPEGIGGQALASLGVTLDAARHEVTMTIGLGSKVPGKSPPFTPRAKKVLELSLREALERNHSYIGTEHILLGLVREGEGAAVRVLANLGVDLDSVRQRVDQYLSGQADPDQPDVSTRVRPAMRTVDVMRPTGRLGRRRSTGTQVVGHTSGPVCPECRTELEIAARYRTIAVAPDLAEGEQDQLPTLVVYCSECGTLLHMFPGDQGGATEPSGE
jgi:hypothetical protein